MEWGWLTAMRHLRNFIEKGGDLIDVLLWGDHPNRKGHELVRDAFLKVVSVGL